MPEKLTRKQFLQVAKYNLLSLLINPPINLLNGIVERLRVTEPISPIRRLNLEQQQFLVNHEIRRGKTSSPNVLMTYDDWPSTPGQLASILNAFKGKGYATFFLLGDRLNWLTTGLLKNYGWDARLIRRIVDEGHQIGMHGWEHQRMTKMGDSELSHQFEKWFNVLSQILPGYIPTVFRAPYGDVDERVRRVGARFGLQHVRWGVESWGDTAKTRERVISGVMGQNGAVVLSHMHRPYDVSQAAEIVNALINNGFRLNTVADGMSPEDQLPG